MNWHIDNVGEIVKEVGQEIILPRWKKAESYQTRMKPCSLEGEDDQGRLSKMSEIYSSIVTDVDLLAEKELSIRLKGLMPESCILGEENYSSNPNIMSVLEKDDPVWIIDPIDGTFPFSRDKQTFGTIISLVKNGIILCGWIYHPVTNSLLVTETGGGTYFCGKRLNVLPSKPLSFMRGMLDMDIIHLAHSLNEIPSAPSFDLESYVCCCSPIMMLTEQKLFDDIDAGQRHFRAITRHCTPWDDAAGVLAIREAGGFVMDWYGANYNPSMMHTGLIAAANQADCLSIRDWLSSALQQINMSTLAEEKA